MSNTDTMTADCASLSRLAPMMGPPRPAIQPRAGSAGVAAKDLKAVGKMLASLIQAESTLYAITRDWRHEAADRRFVRLHQLFEEQFRAIGTRLTRLATRSHELGAWNCRGHGEGALVPQAAVARGASQTYMIRELLRLHETLIARLKRTRSVTGGRLADNETAGLLAALAADHETDASMLRTLLRGAEQRAA